MIAAQTPCVIAEFLFEVADGAQAEVQRPSFVQDEKVD